MRKIVFGVRESRLAKAQLEEFISHMKKSGMSFDFEIKGITTSGDRDRTRPIETMSPGIFIKELEQRLVNKEIDCAVHSLKDVPVDTADKTVLACFPPRGDERDCMVVNKNPFKIATGSPRRQAFIRELFPDAKTLPVRGNVDTRLKKLDAGDFDAIVLAACGLERLGMKNRISRFFDSSAFVPAAGQGAICGQIREDDEELLNALRTVSCQETETAVCAERSILKEFDIGCQKPFGVFARFEDGEFVITARMHIEKKNFILTCRHSGNGKEPDIVVKEFIRLFKKDMDIVLKDNEK